MLINDEETPLDEAVEPTHRESEEVKHCGQPLKVSDLPYTREHDYIISRTTGAAVEVKFGPLSGGMVPKNPFASQLQQKFLYANPDKVGGKEKLKEWSAATDFKHLPKKAKKK